MARFRLTYARELFVVVVLAATGAAFVYTEREKLKPSPLRIVEVDESFAPLCRCSRARARIVLELRARSRVTLAVVAEDGTVVRTLIDNREPALGGRVLARWNGRDDAGRVVPDGIYRPQLHVARERRTFLLTTRIRVDTVPPAISDVRVVPSVFVRARQTHVNVFYRLSERAQPLLYVNRRLASIGWWRRDEAKLEWRGNLARRPVRPGRYALTLRGRDEAGNLGAASVAVVVRVRRGR